MSTVSSVIPTVTAQGGGLWSDLQTLEMTPEFAEHQAAMRAQVFAVLSPLNISILVIVFTIIWYRSRPTPTPQLPGGAKPVIFQSFTPRSLLRFNGVKNDMNPEGKVYLAVKGKVHDVTPGRNFYGPGGAYENFAGRDATRGLACQSFDEDMLTQNLDGPLDDCADLTPDQVENLEGWVERFDEKYLVVGKLIPFNLKKSAFLK